MRKKLLTAAWLLIPVVLLAVHYGPGQRGIARDDAAEKISAARAAEAEESWTDAVQLYADAVGHFTSPNGESAEGTYVFTGGTGRFQNASGEAEFTVKPDEVGFDVTFKGTIQY